ncbi:MAG: hypothetical protein AB7V58_00915 [Solirubrobacterales bacterium]
MTFVEGTLGASGVWVDRPRTHFAGEATGPFLQIPDGLVLAALERAERHQVASEVWVRILVGHLGLKPTAHATRRLRSQLEYLRDAGCVRRTKKQGREYWSLTTEGRDELARSREAEVVGELLESPQHRAWREARDRARAELSGFRELTDSVLEDAGHLAGDTEQVVSEKCFQLAERLAAVFWLAGSATYCRAEWREPDERFPDVDPDPGSPPGRRAVSAWRAIAVKAQGGDL